MLKNLGKQVCSNCGSDQVQMVVWYRPNTKEVVDEYGDPEDEGNCWCDVCEEHYELISEEDFKDLNKTQ